MAPPSATLPSLPHHARAGDWIVLAVAEAEKYDAVFDVLCGSTVNDRHICHSLFTWVRVKRYSYSVPYLFRKLVGSFSLFIHKNVKTLALI